MCKVCASSHKYPHVEKNQESLWTEFQKYCGPADCHEKRINLRAKRKTSGQKEKPHNKKENLRAKRKISQQKEKPQGKKKNLRAKRKTSQQNEKPQGKKKNLTAKRKRLAAKEKRIKNGLLALKKFCHESLSFCRKVFLFAVTVVGHRTKVRKTTSNWIVRILNKVGLQ